MVNKKKTIVSGDILPFVKWIGGKRQLLPQILERMPLGYENYYEPFVGGGALLFELAPSNAVINDINKALICVYEQVRDRPEELIKLCNELDNGWWDDVKSYYYTIRNSYNNQLKENIYDLQLASFFIFLNKHCFNGLYRVNRNGIFNAAYNNSCRPSIDEDMIRKASLYLKDVKIHNCDFEKVMCDCQKGDFVFIDSPYIPLNSTSFEQYDRDRFTVEDHRRLARMYDDLTEKGCYCMATNHNTEFVYELYGNKGYRIDVVSVKRMVNSDASNRVGEEVIICNY